MSYDSDAIHWSLQYTDGTCEAVGIDVLNTRLKRRLEYDMGDDLTTWEEQRAGRSKKSASRSRRLHHSFEDKHATLQGLLDKCDDDWEDGIFSRIK